MIDNKTDTTVAPSARTPVGLPLVDEEKEDQETVSMRKLLLTERAKWETVTMRDSNWGEAQRELRRINRALKRLEG